MHLSVFTACNKPEVRFASPVRVFEIAGGNFYQVVESCVTSCPGLVLILRGPGTLLQPDVNVWMQAWTDSDRPVWILTDNRGWKAIAGTPMALKKHFFCFKAKTIHEAVHSALKAGSMYVCQHTDLYKHTGVVIDPYIAYVGPVLSGVLLVVVVVLAVVIGTMQPKR